MLLCYYHYIITKVNDQTVYCLQDTLLNLDDWQERTNKRYTEIKETADRIMVLLKENMELFNMQDNQESDIWLSYIAFIDNLIEETLFKTIACR